MTRILAAVAISMLLGLCVTANCDAQAAYPKIMPYSLQYPLISKVPFRSRSGDPYERGFLVQRFLKGVQARDVLTTLRECIDWYDVFGGYGTIGHGEDVFTAKAAYWRKTHRGK